MQNIFFQHELFRVLEKEKKPFLREQKGFYFSELIQTIIFFRRQQFRLRHLAYQAFFQKIQDQILVLLAMHAA